MILRAVSVAQIRLAEPHGTGRKFNPLRNRTEPATYEVDELLLGTILFVMLSAIFPTIMAFYFAFASVSSPATFSGPEPASS